MPAHDNMGSRRDPHMKNPAPKFIIIVIIIVLIAVLFGPKIYEIYNDNLNDTENRAENS